MRKILLGNIERNLLILAWLAVFYSLVDALIVGRDQMLMSEEGMVGIFNFLLSFLYTGSINLAVTLGGVAALYLLSDIRALLIQASKKN